MAHQLFGALFPEIAGKETRVVTITDQKKTGLPPGEYGLIELYCTDPDCDCRNVYIQVVQEEFPGPLATISYGWESLAYYKEWMGAAQDDEILEGFKGPALAPGARQSPFARDWLRIFSDILQTDKAYAKGLERRYQLVKGFIRDQKPH
jgi:hypothetical protein